MTDLAYDYLVMTEEEALKERYQLFPEGEYDAHVMSATRKPSSSNNDMIELSLSVYGPNKKIRTVTDYLVFTPQMMWKIIHFCKSANLLEEYQNKKFNHLLAQDKNVRVKLKIKKGDQIPPDKLNGKEPGSKYPDRNSIDDYLVTANAFARYNNSNKFNNVEGSSDIPF